MNESGSHRESARRHAFASVLAHLSENRLLGLGPNGEQPAALVDFELSDSELARVRRMGASAAIVMHYSGNDWSRAQVAGLTSQFDYMGIAVLAVSDAEFEPKKQVADIEHALALGCDVIVSIPTDPVVTADAYRRAVGAGVKLVFMDNVPAGARAGRDYVSVVSTDNFGAGVISANLMAEALGGTGEIGLIVHDADFFVTRQRHQAFRRTLSEDYPGITVVDEIGVSGPAFAAEAEAAVTSMIDGNPGLRGIWAIWDVLAEGVVAAARRAGRSDLVVTTVDLGFGVALELASGGIVHGVGAQRPFDQGVAEAELAAYGLLDKPAPAYVALSPLPVSRASVLEAWESVYHAAPPSELRQRARYV